VELYWLPVIVVVSAAGGAAVSWTLARAMCARRSAEAGVAAASHVAAIQERLAARSARVAELEGELADARTRAEARDSRITELLTEQSRLAESIEQQRKSHVEKLALLDEARVKLEATFQALSAQALSHNNESFLQLAKSALETYAAEAKGDLEQKQKAVETLVAPLRESLAKVDEHIVGMERQRATAYGGLIEQVGSLSAAQQSLQRETANLVKALRSPAVRGRWGEMQLRRVVELAGMLEQCDFYDQQSVDTEDGRVRPDLVVRLPGGKQIVVDAKAPLLAYLESVEATDDASRVAKLREHAQQIRSHMTKLSEKAYWKKLQPTPEFVFLFLPGDVFYSAALEHDPALIEDGANQRVILATPTTLIALLRAVAYGWSQERIAENAQKVSELGRELYDRVRVFAQHFDGIHEGLLSTLNSYNSAAASLESRVLVSVRRFKELGVSTTDQIEPPKQVDQAPRPLRSRELLAFAASLDDAE
jgi:DNA recombination protein RmuC